MLEFQKGPAMKVRTRTTEGFRARLAALRGARGLSQEALAKARQRHGLTQAEPGKAVGVSQQVIACHEAESDQPPGALLVDLAQALKISADELLGLKPSAEKTPPKTARLRKRLQLVEQLPAADQRTVLKLVEALAEARRQSRPRTKARAAS